MQQIEMRRKFWHGNGTRHREAAFQERPIKRLSIEGYQHRASGDAPGEFMKERMFFREITHQELLDLKTAGIPPGQAHEKCVGSRATCKPRRLGIEEEPFRRIC